MFEFTLSKALFIVSALLCVLGAVAHELAGAPMVLGPLKDSGLEDQVVWLHHFSWHVGTVAVIAMAGLYLLAIWHSAGTIFALIASLMSTGFAAFGITLATFGNSALWSTPAPYPWAIIAVLGFAGVFLSRSTA